MSEEKKDPKAGDEKQPIGTGQPAKKEATDSDNTEKVEISKSELEKLQKKSKDFDGIAESLKAKNRVGRTIPGVVAPVKQKEKSDDDTGEDDDAGDDSQEFVTKQDFAKNIEKSAIKEAQKDPEVDDNWDSIMEFYQPRHGKDTVEDILTDIQTAKKVWKAEHPSAPAPKDKGEGDSKVASDLAADKGIGEGKEKKPEVQKKSILKQNRTPMKEWYP